MVGFAPKDLVRGLVSDKEMSEIFGGHLEYEEISSGQRYLGVWGNRKVNHLLRLLRERGAIIEVEHPEPSLFRQRHRASH